MRNLRPLAVPRPMPAGAAFGLALGQGLVGGANNFVQGYQAAKQARMQQAMEAARMQWEREKFDAEQAGKIGVAQIGAGATLGAAKMRADVAREGNRLTAEEQARAEAHRLQQEFDTAFAPYLEGPAREFNFMGRVQQHIPKWLDRATRAEAEAAMAPVREEFARFMDARTRRLERGKTERASVRAQTDLDIRDERDAMNRIDETIGGFVRDKGLVNFDLAGVRDAFQRAGGQIRTAALGWVRGRREPNFDDQGKIIRAVHEMLIGNAVGLKLRQQPDTSEEELNALREALRNDPVEQLRAKSIALDGILPRLLTLPAR